MTDESFTSESARMATYGWLPWPAAVALMDAADGVWLEPAGIVHRDSGPWPTQLPLTTRIHAWSDHPVRLLWRLVPRTSTDSVLLTALTTDITIAPPFPGSPVRTIEVAVTETRDDSWQRVQVNNVLIGRRAAVTFLHPIAAPAGGLVS